MTHSPSAPKPLPLRLRSAQVHPAPSPCASSSLVAGSVVLLLGAAMAAQTAPRERAFTCAVPTRVSAVLREDAARPIHTRAPRRELGVTGAERPTILVPEAWTWCIEPLVPADLDGESLRKIAAAAAAARAPALSLAGCTRLTDADLAPLADIASLRQLDLSDCPQLGAGVLTHLRRLPALAWLRTDGSGVEAGSEAAPATLRGPALDQRVAAVMKEQGLIGVALAVVAEGRIAYARGYGLADREAGKPVRPGSTSFRWASISKPVTAVAALQLHEQGRLDLDADVRELVPEFPAKPQTITARQLLTHQAGIVHYRNGDVVRSERTYDAEHPFADVVTALDTFKESPLVCVPGSRHSYSTHGYILLGAVTQRAGAAAFWTQVREHIAAPLGMASFQPDYPWVDIPDRTQGYRKLAGVVARSSDEDVSWKLPGGGFTSTVVDLARFAQGLLDGSLLRAETQAAMFTAQATADGKATRYGLGIGVGDLDGDACVRHSGAQDKTRTNLVILPGRQLAVAVMCNSEWAELGDLTTDLLRLAR